MDESATARGRATTLAFLSAVKSADAGGVRALLARDPALARARDEEGAIALHHAAEWGHRQIVALLLLVAIRERDARRVRRLVTRLPALAVAADRFGKPLAHHAAECGNEEIARLFREARDGARRSEEDEGA